MKKETMHNRTSPLILISIILALVAISSAALAGAISVLQRGSAAPGAELAYAQASALIATPTGAPDSAAATAAPSPSATATPSPSLSPTATATATPAATASPTLTPSPSPSPTPSPTPTPTPTPAPTPVPAVKPAVKTITIAALINGMGDRPLDAYGSIGIVKRGRIAYYAWAQDLYLYDGKTTRRILENASCGWMYVDAASNLWFAMKGGSGIVAGEVRDWDSVYRYDRAKGAFSAVVSEGANCRLLDGYGIALYGQYFFCEEKGMLTAWNTADGTSTVVGAMRSGTDVVVNEPMKAIYYQDARRQYVLLSHFGEKNYSRIALDLRKFPGGRFETSAYVLGEDGALYRFQRTGYEKLRAIAGAPAGAAGPCMATGAGIGIPRSDTALMDSYDFNTGTWSVLGNPRQEAAFCGIGEGGRFWFVGWKPASLTLIYKGKCTRYDLSKSMGSCAWAGAAGSIVFLSDNDFYSSFTHVFLADKRQLYLVQFPPLPGERLGQ